MKKIVLQIALCSFFAFTGLFCAGKPPHNEYNIAHAAIEAAKKAGATTHAPSLWHSADRVYQKALRLYRDRDYAEARQHFLKAKKLAEKAENVALLKKMNSGDVEP